MSDIDIGAFLIGIPFSIIADFNTSAIQGISKKIFDQGVEPLKKLYIDAFLKSLDYHIKYYDEYSKKLLKSIKSCVEKDAPHPIW